MSICLTTEPIVGSIKEIEALLKKARLVTEMVFSPDCPPKRKLQQKIIPY
jgi:hypothetical protein